MYMFIHLLQLWDDLQGRMRDKVVSVEMWLVKTIIHFVLPSILQIQWSIRRESINSLARLYRQIMSSSFSSGASSVKSSDAR